LLASPETIAVMDWINTDDQRSCYWRERAESSFARSEMSGAVAKLAAPLCDEITASVEQQDLLAQRLVHTILMRINYYELAVSLLSEVDDSGCFEPQPIAA